MEKTKLSLVDRLLALCFVISIIFTARTFELLELPLYYFIEIGVLVGILVLLIVIYVMGRSTNVSLDKKVLFTAGLTLFLNVFSPIMANINFGQSIILGILAFRIPIMAAVIYLLYYGIFKYKVKVDNERFFEYVISWLFIMSLLITLVWIYLTYTLNAEYYYFSSGSLLVDTRSDGSYRFRFDIFFPFMLLCCSWYKSSKNKSRYPIVYWFTLGLSIIYLIFYFQGRVFIGALALSFFLCYIRTYVYSTRYVILYLLVFISVLLSIVVYFTYGELIELYQNMLRSLSLNDSSSLVRLRILRVMQNNFIDNFLLGNGYLSNQADINMGDTKFSPLDIGVLGVIYTYGFILFLITFSWFSKLWLDSFNKINAKLYTFCFSVLYLNMLFTGGFFFRPYQIMLLLIFHMLFNRNKKDLKKGSVY